jgi:cell division protein FtsQ
MAREYTLFENILPRFEKSDGSFGSDDPARSGSAKNRTKGSGSPRSGKIFKWFFFLALLALAVELIWFLGVTPFRPFTRIEVSGFTNYDRDSLLAYAGITPRSSFILTNVREMEILLADLPQIESVRIFKRFPGRLDIHLQNRKAAGLTFADIDGITVPVIIDRLGVVFQIGTAYSGINFLDLPLISGLLHEAPVLGMRLPARFFSFLEDLESIRTNAPELLSSVSEIRLDRNSTDGLDLTLYLVQPKIKVRLSGLNEELLRYTLLVADVMAAREPGIDMIDFRAGMASYFPKGGPL